MPNIANTEAEWYEDDQTRSPEELAEMKVIFDLSEIQPLSEWLSDEEIITLCQEAA